MAEKKLKPKIRFKGYNDDWEQRKLSELCIKFTDGDWIEAKDQSNKGVRLIQTGNVGVTRYLDKSSNQKWISEDTFERLHCEEIFPGDILISRLPEPAGRACIIPDLGKKMITAVDCTIVRTKPEVSNKYLVQYLSTDDYFNKVNTCLAGGTRQRISRSNLSEFIVPIPKEDKEQKKIGGYFQYMDNLITFYQCKHDKLINVKKSMLEKMFPKNGASVPEIRFKGFTDDWEQRKVGDVIDGLYNGQTPSRFRDDFWDGNINWLSSGELNRSVVMTTSEKITVAGQDDANLHIVPKNTFVMAITGLEATGTRGNCGILGIDTTLNQSCMAIFPNKKLLSTQFLFQWYKMVGEDYGVRFTQGTKQQSYNAEIVRNLDICLPKVEEQLKIGELFSELDNLITLHQRKLEKLKNIKKSMLEKMFI